MFELKECVFDKRIDRDLSQFYLALGPLAYVGIFITRLQKWEQKATDVFKALKNDTFLVFVCFILLHIWPSDICSLFNVKNDKSEEIEDLIVIEKMDKKFKNIYVRCFVWMCRPLLCTTVSCGRTYLCYVM